MFVLSCALFLRACSAVREAESEFVALLNNDLTIINPDWLGEMVSQGLQPGVGAVGARLLYPDDHIQHAGVILGGGGVAAHAHKGLPRANHGYFSRAILSPGTFRRDRGVYAR